MVLQSLSLGRGNTAGATKAKAPKKGNATQKRNGKRPTPTRKSEDHQLPKPKPSETTTSCNKITPEQLQDITSDASCLVWMPVPTEPAAVLPFDG